LISRRKFTRGYATMGERGGETGSFEKLDHYLKNI